MVLRKFTYRIIFLAFFGMFHCFIYSQESEKYSITENKAKFVIYGFDKFIDIYNFRTNINYFDENEFGYFQLFQNYKGNALTGSTKMFQDEQESGLKYAYPITDFISIQIQQGWIFFSNSRNKDLNQFSRLNGLAGVRFNYNSSFVEFAAGKEDNRQIGINSIGNIFKINGRTDDIELEGYRLKAVLNSQLINLDNDRNNTEIFNYGEIKNQFSDFDNFNFNYSYIFQDKHNLLLRNNNQNTNLSDINNYSIENRFRQKINGNINLDVNPFESFFTNVRLDYSNETVKLQYREFVPTDAKTGAIRERNLNQLGITTEGRLQLKRFSQLFGLSFNIANEDNIISVKFNISENELFKLKSLYTVQNNNINENKLYSSSNWNITNFDSLNLNFSLSLRQFNTPSEDDNTDMDEFRMYGIINYGRHLNQELSAGISFELQMNHQVYLKSQRSAGNSWLRIIKLSPYTNIQTKSFSIRPKFEVLANYTIYDFEDIALGVKSFSFRQIGYKDSVSIKIYKNHYITSELFFRYFEIGILYWKTFAESPQKSNTEFFSKLLWNYNYSENLQIFIGARFNNLGQSSLIKNAPSGSEYRQLSYGPEMNLYYLFWGNSQVLLRGWYEFQFINQNQRVEFPNIFLTTNIRL